MVMTTTRRRAPRMMVDNVMEALIVVRRSKDRSVMLVE
jgi:hypothetical protein